MDIGGPGDRQRRGSPHTRPIANLALDGDELLAGRGLTAEVEDERVRRRPARRPKGSGPSGG